MELVNPSRKPPATVSGSYGFGWQQLWKHFVYFLIVSLIVAFAESLTSGLKGTDEKLTLAVIGIQLVVVAYWLLVLPVINYGADLLFLRGIRDEKMEVEVLFRGFRENYLNIVLANFLTAAIVGIGLVFLIIPGIILGCRLVFVPYLVMDKHLEPIAAIEKSWEMTRGHAWTVFWMAILAILVIIAGLICFLVGVFISAMWISASFATLYHAIDTGGQARMEEAGVA